MTGVFETVRADGGRIRLLDRHLARMARAGVPPGLLAGVRARLERVAAAADDPVVVRVEVDGCGIRLLPRPPNPATPVDLRSVVGFDPDDPTREAKRTARGWAEAAEASVGGEALLVSAEGLVGETTRANVFAVLDDAIVTPPARGLLPGVTRGWAVEAAGAVERPLRLDELRSATAGFLTTAGRGVVRIASVDGVALGDDPRIERLAAAWRAL